ncbi:MAG: hypothetical protein R2828_04825 [Saprospiraceae bacterium]
MKTLLFRFLKAIFIIVLPFFALIRGAVFLHENYPMWPWTALFGGVLMSTSLIFIYLIYVQSWLKNKFGKVNEMKRAYWGALVLVLVYCLPALFYLSNHNAKHPDVQKEFTKLHPILRLGVSTLVFIDKDLLLTDGSRVPEDYRKMGLRRKSHSLHYIQSTGYAHAVDIRTNNRSNLRNWLIKNYFYLMGFNTLRHVGTDDHLHVSIMSRDRKGGI